MLQRTEAAGPNLGESAPEDVIYTPAAWGTYLRVAGIRFAKLKQAAELAGYPTERIEQLERDARRVEGIVFE